MNLRPLGDRVILKYQEAEEKTKSGILLPDSAMEKPQVAVVISVGPGKCVDGKQIPVEVKEGDKVIVGQYAGTRVTLDEEEYTIADQNEILAIVD